MPTFFHGRYRGNLLLLRRSIGLAAMPSPLATADPHQTARLPLSFSSESSVLDPLNHILISHVVHDILQGQIEVASTVSGPIVTILLLAAINLIISCYNFPM
ncbi:hypothetical protein SORBI_3004G136366 [Sorghum bicolor]|uniref:Uncharacterized protein n=1 Tax=Sorghum bicolor TaxID=4558 RepID=A0A1Z5RMA3_SORBI|nr:hypothetical protein SORBI_3004G136366 [Sorghum bicolor]